MLEITIPEKEYYDSEKECFIYRKAQKIVLEHSLVSLSKWESKWKRSFLNSKSFTNEESLDYVRCMTLTQNVDPETYKWITSDIMKQISDYINDPMTATTFSDNRNDKPNREIITAEIIYYDMTALNIPFECQKWHLNRLLTLIKVCNIKQQPPKKMGKRELAQRNHSLNAARRARLGTKG